MGKNRPLADVPQEVIDTAVLQVLDHGVPLAHAAAGAGIAVGSLTKILNHVPPDELPYTGHWHRQRGVLIPVHHKNRQQKEGTA